MQCARCHGVLSTPKRVGRTPRPKGARRFARSEGAPKIDPADWAERVAAFEAEHAAAPPAGFFALYSRAVALCALTAFISAAVLFFLSFSVLHAGAVALPFLGIFAVGLLLSLGLPFKMYREYKRFSE